jgi:hypothetical protein
LSFDEVEEGDDRGKQNNEASRESERAMSGIRQSVEREKV